MTTLNIEDRHLKIVKDILSQYPYTFYAFGSRVKGNPRKFSDLDLMYKDDIPAHIVSDIREDFEESDLPYTVDLVAWKYCNENFRKLIEKDCVKI